MGKLAMRKLTLHLPDLLVRVLENRVATANEELGCKEVTLERLVENQLTEMVMMNDLERLVAQTPALRGAVTAWVLRR